MRVAEVIKRLNEDGWYELPRKATSHIQLKHPTKSGKVTVSNHPGDIPPFTLKSIWKQAGISPP
ncbi:MAG: type II toxin-antitoxin system HicA family toxin [Oscillospiraceae bacterium]|nr:type II toxin-antitoxin system HicA family toxin [Oscillospiraceae bacterium]